MTDVEQEKVRAAHGKVIARAWRDPAFKAKLLADPHAALQELGVAVPAGVTVKVVENTDKHVHLVLPPKPSGALSDEDLDHVAGGHGWGGHNVTTWDPRGEWQSGGQLTLDENDPLGTFADRMATSKAGS